MSPATPRGQGRRRLRGGRLVIASHNPGKVREIAELLGPYGAEIVSAAGLGLAEPDETGPSFAANAELKAIAAAKASGCPALADDSGLVVPALDGAPGILSARWAGPDRNFAAAMARVHKELTARELSSPGGVARVSREAHFICALALAWPDGACEVFEGRVDGRIVWPPRGSRGFGYDPIFQPEGRSETFGEMDPDQKHAISHRADAFRKLVAAQFAA